MEKLKISLAAVVVVVTFVLIAQNQEVVVTRVLLWELEMPRFILLGSVFLLGCLAGYLLGRKTRLSG